MRAGAFWRDQLPAVLLNLCGGGALALFLLAGRGGPRGGALLSRGWGGGGVGGGGGAGVKGSLFVGSVRCG